MEFSVNKADLVRELNLSQGVVERKTTIPILSNILIEASGDALVLTATDLELGIRCEAPAKVKTAGAGTIPAKKLLDYVRLLPEAEVQVRVSAALELLGISELAGRVPHDLSGGEKRKVALAGALVMEPQLLVLDEPFEGLDPSARSGLVALIERLSHEQGVTVVMSTHDIDSVAELADYVYALRPGGEIALRGTPAEVFAQADKVAASNIKPPILAELFDELRSKDASAPQAALTVDAAAEALLEWRRS